MQVRIQRGREVDGFSAASPLSAEFRARGLHKLFVFAVWGFRARAVLGKGDGI